MVGFDIMDLRSHIRYAFCCLILVVSLSEGQTTYYISTSGGNNSNNGTSEATPWQTTDKIQMKSPAFQPGDRILLKRGERFEGNIVGLFQGTPDRPIIIGAYGTGARPIVDGNTMGGIPGRRWTAVPGRPGYFYWYGGYAVTIGNNFYEVYDGGAHLMTSKPQDTFGNRSAWLDALSPGQFGPPNWTDTVWVHTHDSGPMDSVVFARSIGCSPNSGSHDWIISDLEFRNFRQPLTLWGVTKGIVRNVKVVNAFGHGILVGALSSNILVDSCYADSSGTTAIYLVTSSNCVVRNNTVTNVQATIRGVPVGGDQQGIGIQGRDSGNPPGSPQGRNNLIEFNTVRDVIGSLVDFYYNEGDIIRYNTGANCGGISPHGTNITVAHNTIGLKDGTGGNAANITNLSATDTIRFYDNRFTNVYGYGLAVAKENLGPVILSGNTIEGTRSATQFVWFSTPTLVRSSGNTFYGPGRWLSGPYPNQVIYTTLQSFQSATNLEQGSAYYSGPPTGTFSATPSSLPAEGGTVTLRWTSTNTTSASIGPTVGPVDPAGSMTAPVSLTTDFVLALVGPLDTVMVTARVTVGVIPSDYFLRQNYPNPFNAGTTIEFGLPKESNVTVKVFDFLGREVATIAEGTYTPGVHQIQWNPEGIASGIYRCRLSTGSYSNTLRMVLIR